MTLREMRRHLEELCGVEVSPDLINWVTDAALEENVVWQAQPLDPVVFVSRKDCKVILPTRRPHGSAPFRGSGTTAPA